MPCAHQWAIRSIFTSTTLWVNNLDDANTDDQWRRLPFRSSTNFLKPFLKERHTLTHQPVALWAHLQTRSHNGHTHPRETQTNSKALGTKLWWPPLQDANRLTPTLPGPPRFILFTELTKALIPPLLPLLLDSLTDGWENNEKLASWLMRDKKWSQSSLCFSFTEMNIFASF